MSTETTHDRQAEKLARMFHETYERLAPEHGYKTREASAVPWEDVPAANKSLMVAVAARIYDAYMTTQLQQARAHAIDQRARAEHAEAERDALTAELDRLKRERAGWRSIAGVDKIAKALGIDSALYETDDVIAIAQRTVAELAEARAAIERLRADIDKMRHGKDPFGGSAADSADLLDAALDASQRPEDTREETADA